MGCHLSVCSTGNSPIVGAGPHVCVPVLVAGSRVYYVRACMCMNVDLCLGRLEGSEKGSELSRDWFSHLADLKISLSLSLVHARLTDSRVSRQCLISSYRSVARLKLLLRKETQEYESMSGARRMFLMLYIYIK